MTLQCPVCESNSHLERMNGSLRLFRCEHCDHCFTDLASIDSFEPYSAEYYSEVHRNWFEHPNTALFDRVAGAIASHNPTASVLDAGCGDGAFLRYVRGKYLGLSLTGIDTAACAPEDGIKFLQGDIMGTSLDGVYDAIVSFMVIEHIPQVDEFIRKMYDLCAPGGLIIINTIDERSVLYGTARLLNRVGLKSAFTRLYSRHHVNHFNSRSLAKLLEVSDLSVRRVFHHNYPLAAVDFNASSLLSRSVMLSGVWGTFVLGKAFGRTVAQTVISQKSYTNTVREAYAK